MSELLGRTKKGEIELDNCKISAKNLAGLSNCVQSGTISSKIAKDVMDIMFETGENAETIIKEKNLTQVTDKTAIVESIRKVLLQNPTQVEEFKAGKVKVVGFLVGLAMKETHGKANPASLNKLLVEELSKA